MTKYTMPFYLNRIDKSKIIYKENGDVIIYLDQIVNDEPNQWGQYGFIVQQSTKEEREQKAKLPYLANFKKVEKRVEPQPQHQSEFKPLPSNIPPTKEKAAKVEPVVTEFYQHKGTQVEWDSVKSAVTQTTLPPEQTSLNMPQGERPNSLFKDAAGDLPF